ncbi:LysR family transcriptional regulator [Rhodococcus sp. NPDC003318]|uniref:LysR family transcriptional regulator n=1 Tax=Rhodococcus sp. NPDC003318 TaxID=3364503 RepID=UPI0036A79E41
MDLHPRMLRYFLAVAEELHFTRAADRLFVTGPALSQQIRQLEHQLGFAVFTRTSRSVALTERGRDMVPLARAVVEASEKLDAWAARAKSGSSRIRLGFMASGAGTLTQQVLESVERQRPEMEVELVHLEWGDQTRALLDGRVDVSFVREPANTERLRCRPILSEPRMVLVPARHRLAERVSGVTFDEIADERFLPSATGDPEWIDYWLVNPRPDGSRARTGPAISTVEEMLEQCAAGHGVAITASAVAQFYSHPGVRFLPVTDLPPNRVLMCSRKDDTNESVAAFEDVVIGLVTSDPQR